VDVELVDKQVENVTGAGEVESIIVSAYDEPTQTIIAERDMLTVSAGLEPVPDAEWRKLWERGDFPNDLDEPHFWRGTRLLFTVAKEDLGRAWDAIKARVEATNAAYTADVVPRREAEKESRERAERAERDALVEAQRLVDELE
jgi:hypothetical protein